MLGKNLKSLIQEEVAKFLNEAVDHTDDEIVGRQNIDLQFEYNKLNQQLFDGTLPIVPLKWDNSKRRLGVVTAARNRFTGEMKVVNLGMSVFYKTNYRQFKNTLAHEMIHVKQIVTGQNGSHGWSFDKEAYRINGMGLGYDITHKNNEEIQVSDEIKANAKTLIAIVYDVDGEYFLSVTTPNVYNNDFDFLLTYYERALNRGLVRNVEITAIESKNPELIGKRILRSFRRGFSYSRLSDNLLEQLLNDKIIKSVKLKKGVPAQISEVELPGNPSDWETIEIS
jgi:hypothetical protein